MINISTESTQPDSLQTGFLAFGVFQDQDFIPTAYQALVDAALHELAKEEGFLGKTGQSFLFHQSGNNGAPSTRVLLLGLGKAQDFDSEKLRTFGSQVVEEANRRQRSEAAIVLPNLTSDFNEERALQILAEGMQLGTYRYTEWLSDESKKKTYLEKASILGSDLPKEASKTALRRAEASYQGIALARDLVNAPPVALTPEKLAKAAEKVAQEEGLDVLVYGPDKVKAEGMNLLHAVGVGSENGPHFIHMTQRPKSTGANNGTKGISIALVGKGITYDAGGYNIKPTGALENMKVDMGGAAAVLGTMKALAAFDLPFEVHGIIASAENLVSHKAYKPGDIIRSHNGLSVEIMNTDAEGRLALADALSYAEKLGVDYIVDLATLTGACMVALGPYMAGLFSNDAALQEKLVKASESVGEELWPMPLSKRLRPMLDSPIADLKNLGERWGGAITAALFLQEFVGESRWAHLDIAGPASNEGKARPGVPPGGTGFAILTLLELLQNL